MNEPGGTEVTPDDFAEIDWEQVIEAVTGGWNYEYANAFYDRASEAEERGDHKAVAVLRLLGDLCSFKLNLETPDEPFRPWMVTSTFQSASPDSISQSDLESLRQVAPTVGHPWLRARMSDFVWSRARGYPMVRLAIESYLALADGLGGPDESAMEALDALERALQLTTRLGPKSDLFAVVSAYLLGAVERMAGEETGMVSHWLMGYAAKYGVGDSVELYGRAAAIAERLESSRKWTQAERYWLLAEDLAISARDEDRRREALRRASETLVARAREVADQPHVGKAMAATHLGRAIEALRRAGGMRERADELHRLMMDYQRDIPASLISTSYEIPLADVIPAAREAVAGKRLEEALLAFALFPPLLNRADLRRQAEENASQYKLKSLFPGVQLNAEGKVVARQGSTDATDPEEREAALEVVMVQLANWHYPVLARGCVLPARDKIMEEHALRLHDLFWIVSNNPLVPQGRELLYAEAFYAGFVGDMPKAIHILVHQLEHSVRELLEAHGVIATTLSRDGIQMERNLNSLLWDPKLVELLDEDTVFALQSLLVAKFGPDLRNRVAHGLMSYQDFITGACYYFWWFSFRLACIPLIRLLRARENPEANGQDSEEGSTPPTPAD